MISARKIKTNRVNARASTGPKTTQGKARAAQNSRHHGLSLSVLSDPVFSAEAKNLAREIVGEGASHESLELAHRIAEAQIDIVRIRQARHDLLSRYLSDLEFRPYKYFKDADPLRKIIAGYMRQFGPEVELPAVVAQYADHILHWKPQGAEKFAYVLSDLAPKLVAIDRYERRALSRRKFAIRAFDAARTEAIIKNRVIGI